MSRFRFENQGRRPGRREAAFGLVLHANLAVLAVATGIVAAAVASQALPSADGSLAAALRGMAIAGVTVTAALAAGLGARRFLAAAGVPVDGPAIPARAPRAVHQAGEHLGRSRRSALAAALAIGALLGLLGASVAPELLGPVTELAASESGDDGSGSGASGAGGQGAAALGGAHGDAGGGGTDGTSGSGASGGATGEDEGPVGRLLDEACSTVDGVEQKAGDLVSGVADSVVGQVDGTSDAVCDEAERTVDNVTGTVDDVVGKVKDTVDDTVGSLPGTVNDTVGSVPGTVNGLVTTTTIHLGL